MKVSLLLILLYSTSFTEAQTWFSAGTEWYYSSDNASILDAGYWYYKSEKDTLIMNNECMKISTTFLGNKGDTNISTPIFVYHSSDSVFFFNRLFNKFTLLYKYDVSIGDTITLHKHFYWASKDSTYRIVVTDISNFSTGNTDLKQIFTKPLDDFTYWSSYIERIGCTNMMLPVRLVRSFTDDGPLRCYKDKSFSINLGNRSCDYLDYVGIKEIGSTKVNLFPNPASDFININYNFTDWSKPEECILEIVNQLGQVVHSQQIPKFSRFQKVHVNRYPTGMYIVSIKRNGNLVATAKFAKE